MSTRPLIKPHVVLENADLSGDLVSLVTIITNITDIGYDISWTGTAVGVFSVEISNTYSLNAAGAVLSAGNWTPLTLSGAVNPAGVTDNGFIDIQGVSAFAIRLVYTSTSGTGTVNAVVTGKVF